MIPKIIHLAWDKAKLPDWGQENLRRFRELNPDYQVIVHNPAVLLSRYEAIAAKLTRADSLSDLWRLSALQRDGGWWFDLDYLPIRPVDDIVRAYGLDGQTMFVTEQHFQRDPRLSTANGILAARSDWAGWAILNDAIDAIAPPYGKVAFGPGLLTKLQRYHPGRFTVGRWPWFYPTNAKDAKNIYHRMMAGELIRELLAVPMRLTGDQLPFVMHLWSGGSGKIETPVAVINDPDEFKGLAVGLIATNQQWRDGTQPFRAVYDGLTALGCRVQVVAPDDIWPIFSDKIDLAVVWNGRRKLYDAVSAGLRRDGIPALYMEHGFFDRRAYTQYDHAGFNHTASWAGDWPQDAPSDGAARLREVWPHDLVPIGPRQGYILVIGQVLGDSQMYESETDDSWVLFQAVRKAVGDGAEVVYRKHPGDPRAMPDDPACLTGGTLAEHIGQAAFVVCINSNAGNEALALGCRVLCLGPALYAAAGVAYETTLADLPAAIAEMRAGWTSDPAAVRRYLQRLACRQWNRAEIAAGGVLADLIRKAVG